jgi:hypothetical protein
MTMRTYPHFACSNGHKGQEMRSENDQPYSTPWESITLTGMKEAGKDSKGYAAYVYQTCGQPMTQTKGP